MPFTGGWSPSPQRTGGGDGGSGATLLQRVFESLATARGDSFDQTLTSIVGAENMAYARAIALDLYGGNQRLSNQFNPATMTADGLLPRWEAILGVPPNFGDTEPIRRARVAAGFARFVQPNSVQAIVDACIAALGPIFVSLTTFDLTNCLRWWPSRTGGTDATQNLYGPCQISSVSGTLATIVVSGTSDIPDASAGAQITLSNCATASNNGTFLVHSWVSNSSVVAAIPGTPVTDVGVGGTGGAPTIHWAIFNPLTPWMSTIAHVDVHVTKAVTGYQNADGSPNSRFFTSVGTLRYMLDELLPSWVTFDWWLSASNGAQTFLLDERNLDLEVFA